MLFKMSLDEEYDFICCDWILEFVCHNVWQKFKRGVQLDQGIQDLINGVVSLQTQRDSMEEPAKSKELVFLMLTSYLMNLGECSSEDSLQPEDFEHISRLVTKLSTLCEEDSDSIASTSADALSKTALQRLLVCCRQDRYDVARALFEEEAENLDKESSRKVHAILQAKSKPHRFLQEDKLSEYVSTVTQFVDAVYSTFPPQPIMCMLAKSFIQKSSAYKGARDVTKGLSKDVQLSSKEEEALSRKLQAIKKKKMEAVVHDVASANVQYISDNDDRSDGNVNPSQSSRKRKAATSAHQERSEVTAKKAVSQESFDDSVSVSEGEEEDEEEETDKNLKSRVPLNLKSFSMRKSLGPASKKPPSHKRGGQLRRKWTGREEEDFYLAVQRFGVGEWQQIRHHLRSDRSNVQLKDKWRTICSTSYKQLSKKFGPVED